MKLFSLHTKQILPISIDKAWDFFKNPKNLNAITPSSLKFETISGDDKEMYPGQIIHYKISVLPFVKFQWVTEITHLIEKRYFVDEQRFGPYRFWHHKHFIHEVEGGVVIEDIVHYQLPVGFLNKILNYLFIRPRINEIFEYRKLVLEEIFGKL